MKNKNKILIDHTLIQTEIEKSIKIYNWGFILPELPRNSFLVGGYIRDLLIGKDLKLSNIDIDIVVPKNALLVGERIAKKFNGKAIILDEEREIIRIIICKFRFDIALQIKESIYEDIISRDFTINAISFDLDSKVIFDPSNGIRDINDSLIKTYKKINLIDDPLRMLRCFRFIAELNFQIDPNLFDFIEHNKSKLSVISEERIQYELRKIIRGKYAKESILLINQINLFKWIQKYECSSLEFMKKINLKNFYIDEIQNCLCITFLIEILNEFSIKKLKFSKSEILKASSLTKWKNKLLHKSINNFSELERFQLHKELENFLPAFILYLPENKQLLWLKRWRDKDDTLFHPTNLVNGDILKNHINIEDGALLGQLLFFLSMELAYDRLENLDEAIYKAERWFQQNAPKYD